MSAYCILSGVHKQKGKKYLMHYFVSLHLQYEEIKYHDIMMEDRRSTVGYRK